MGRLSPKKLKRKNLPYGKYTYMVTFRRTTHNTYHCANNIKEIEEIRRLLRSASTGIFRFEYKKNRRKKKVYTHLLLTSAMDLALIKLVHSEKMHKIYKIEVSQLDQIDESPSEIDQIAV